MPRFTISTSGIQTHYAARVEDAERITAYHDALRSRYPTEGDGLMYDVLRTASADFTKQAKGKAILEYLDGRYWHILPPTQTEIVAVTEEGLIDISELLKGATWGSPVVRDPIY